MDSLEYMVRVISLVEEPIRDISASVRQLDEEAQNLLAAINKIKAELTFRMDEKEIDEAVAVNLGVGL